MSRKYNPIPVKHMRSPRVVQHTSSKRNPKPAQPPSDPEFEKAYKATLHFSRVRRMAEYIWRKAQDIQMQRDFEIAYKEDQVAAWEIRAGFDKRRGIVRV